MSIHSELRDELVAAMRAGDKARVNVIRQVETEVAVAKAAPGFSGQIDDDLYLRTIASYVKKMDKARQEYEGIGERGRDHAARLAFEVGYLGRWLPKTLGETETRSLVRTAIAELGASDAKAAGRVIGRVMQSADGLDGGLVNRLVREELGA